MTFGQPMHRQVLLLATAQALFQTTTVLVMTIGALAGATAAPQPELATAPIAAMLLGTTLGTVPASMLMARVGRRPGFIVGALAGTAAEHPGGGLHVGRFAAAALGRTFLVGIYQGFAQFYRFAASEVADEGFRPRAISLVMAGGVAAAILGPMLAQMGGPLLTPAFTGSFLLLALVSLVAAGLLTGLNVPRPAPRAADADGGRPLPAIIRQPAYAVALFGAATGGGVMILAMTATPLAMTHHQHALPAAALVIQLHVLGMFLPSFFTGSLIARFGVLRIMLTGVGLLAGHVLLSLSGTGLASFASALVLLGIGWNFLYIGGTTLLTETYSEAEKGRAQATNDMTIFGVSLASLSAGLLHQLFGWQMLNLLLLPWLGTAALALIWLASRRRPVAETP